MKRALSIEIPEYRGDEKRCKICDDAPNIVPVILFQWRMMQERLPYMLQVIISWRLMDSRVKHISG
jgi:hypothetical protein